MKSMRGGGGHEICAAAFSHFLSTYFFTRIGGGGRTWGSGSWEVMAPFLSILYLQGFMLLFRLLIHTTVTVYVYNMWHFMRYCLELHEDILKHFRGSPSE